jgi:hypothetical protein
MLVLIGPQGKMKSSVGRVMAGEEFFSDSLPADLSSKDARDHLAGKWWVELSELSQFRKSDVETVKSFVSRQVERYRPAYGRYEITVPRQNIFFGTTNADTPLIDPTGNRRFWVVSCSDIDLDGLKRDRSQLWGEAVARYKSGETWHLDQAQASLAEREALERVASDPWTSTLSELLGSDSCLSTHPDNVSPGEALHMMNIPQRDRHAGTSNRVAKILVDLGWTKGKRDSVRGRLYRRPADPLPQKPPDEAVSTPLHNQSKLPPIIQEWVSAPPVE